MTWVERIQNWIAWFVLQVQQLIVKDSLSAIIVEKLTGFGTKEAVDGYYDALPANIKNDPEIIAAWNKARDSKQSLDSDILAKITAAVDTAITEISSTYLKMPGYTPDTAPDGALKLLAFDLAKEKVFAGITLGVETATLGQIDTAGDFFKTLSKRTGYGGPITQLLKAPIELGLIHPLSMKLHEQYREAWLPGHEALTLATKGHLPEATMRKSFAYEGMPDWAIDAIVADRYRELRVGELAWAMTDSMTDDAWIDKKLQAALYSPEDRPLITRMLRERYLRPYRDQVASLLVSMYKEGYITYAQFSDRLKQLGIPDQVRNMMASKAQYMYTMDYNTDLIATWVTAYKNDIINEDTLRGNLSSIIADPARVEGQVNKAKAARKPTSVKPPAAVKQGIRVSSKPSNAFITLDNTDIGKLTPETLTTTVGRHNLIVSADGYDDAQYEVDVAAGQFVEVYAVLDKTQAPL